jgi:hypothetical protein
MEFWYHYLQRKSLKKLLSKQKQATLMQNNTELRLELFTEFSLKDPYPNKAEIICSDPIIKAIVAGRLKNKLNSRALFCMSKILSFFFDWICFESCGSITTPIAIPAIAKLI